MLRQYRKTKRLRKNLCLEFVELINVESVLSQDMRVIVNFVTKLTIRRNMPKNSWHVISHVLGVANCVSFNQVAFVSHASKLDVVQGAVPLTGMSQPLRVIDAMHVA